MFKKTPSYLEAYLTIVESDLAAEQESVNEERMKRSHSLINLTARQTRINMSHRAIESLRRPVTPRPQRKFQ